ncbi:MAG TPA: hypothetical protein VGG99_26845 [Acetobacteraceae bacterium]|jgi:hypothetical protein
MLHGAAIAADPGSCLAEAGQQKARTLVDQCLMVSPATHPPCNAANPCALIIDEIRRGCGMLGSGKPGFCDPVRGPR